VDKVVTVPGYGEVATDGRSGGIALAALDYRFAGLPVPSHRPEDFPDRPCPRTAPAYGHDDDGPWTIELAIEATALDT
jgi:hypothetical protein